MCRFVPSLMTRWRRFWTSSQWKVCPSPSTTYSPLPPNPPPLPPTNPPIDVIDSANPMIPACACIVKLDAGFFTCSQTIPNHCNRFVAHSMCEVITKVIRCVCRLRLLAPLYLLCAIHTIRIGQCKAGKSSH